MTSTQSTRKVRLVVEVDAAAWAKLANIDPKRVPADVHDYFIELLQTARSSYAPLITDINLAAR